jgi:hypothetical protein
MDLARMLDKCERDQWSADQLDWSLAPPRMARDKEEAVVQYFTDMAGLERLAGALFAAQVRKAKDPTLRAIFESFVVDEERHAVVAERLARHYDVHRWRRYEISPALIAFRPYFLRVIEQAPPEIANAYVTAGELMLDVALLRSIDDYVGDEMSHRAMQLINRDESRHIAIDFHMTEFYASDEFLTRRRARAAPSLRARARGTAATVQMLWRAQPFLKAVFLDPIDRTDPSGRRIREAFKRMQLVMRKPTVARLPFTRFMIAMQELLNHKLAGPLLGGLILRVLGGERRIAAQLFTDEELRRAQAMSFDELAEDAVGAKYATP